MWDSKSNPVAEVIEKFKALGGKQYPFKIVLNPNRLERAKKRMREDGVEYCSSISLTYEEAYRYLIMEDEEFKNSDRGKLNLLPDRKILTITFGE